MFSLSITKAVGSIRLHKKDRTQHALEGVGPLEMGTDGVGGTDRTHRTNGAGGTHRTNGAGGTEPVADAIEMTGVDVPAPLTTALEFPDPAIQSSLGMLCGVVVWSMSAPHLLTGAAS